MGSFYVSARSLGRLNNDRGFKNGVIIIIRRTCLNLGLFDCICFSSIIRAFFYLLLRIEHAFLIIYQ